MVLTKRALDFQPSFIVPTYLRLPLLITTSFYCACSGHCVWQSRKNITFSDTWVWYITIWALFLVFINTSNSRCIQGFPETGVSTSLQGMSNFKWNIKRNITLDYLLLLVLLFIVISYASGDIFILWASLFSWLFFLSLFPHRTDLPTAFSFFSSNNSSLLRWFLAFSLIFLHSLVSLIFFIYSCSLILFFP